MSPEGKHEIEDRAIVARSGLAKLHADKEQKLFKPQEIADWSLSSVTRSIMRTITQKDDPS